MNNVHTPERLQGESFADYRERRQASQRAARIVERGAAIVGEFVLHTASPEKRARRALIARVGRRQAIKQFRFAF